MKENKWQAVAGYVLLISMVWVGVVFSQRGFVRASAEFLKILIIFIAGNLAGKESVRQSLSETVVKFVTGSVKAVSERVAARLVAVPLASHNKEQAEAIARDAQKIVEEETGSFVGAIRQVLLDG